MKYCHYSNIDGLGGHYAKWNKSNGEGQILNDITYIYGILKIYKLVNITKEKPTHKYREQTSGYSGGCHGDAGAVSTNYWVSDRL